MVNDNLGRDNLWSSDIWDDIDAAVTAEVGRVRVAQKIFPTIQVLGAQYVPADKLKVADMLTIEEGQTKPFIEISVDFKLTQAQVDNESTLHTARTLARLAAKTLAITEDNFIFQGKHPPHKMARVHNGDSAGNGLLGVAAASKELPVSRNDRGVFGEATFAAITQGRSLLVAAGQPGPYALILESSAYADTYTLLPQTGVTVADRLPALLTGGFYGTGSLPNDTGILTSLAGDPTTLYVSRDAATAFTQQDQEGNYRFRAFERIQFVARVPEAFIKLSFEAEDGVKKRAKPKVAAPTA